MFSPSNSGGELSPKRLSIFYNKFGEIVETLPIIIGLRYRKREKL